MAATAHREPSAAARRLADAPAFRLAVRTGFVGRGLTYAVIGAIAIALALGAGSMGRRPTRRAH